MCPWITFLPVLNRHFHRKNSGHKTFQVPVDCYIPGKTSSLGQPKNRNLNSRIAILRLKSDSLFEIDFKNQSFVLVRPHSNLKIYPEPDRRSSSINVTRGYLRALDGYRESMGATRMTSHRFPEMIGRLSKAAPHFSGCIGLTILVRMVQNANQTYLKFP
jgi:hypothetical protein